MKPLQHHVTNHTQIALKSLLVYTCDLKMQLACDKNYTKKSRVWGEKWVSVTHLRPSHIIYLLKALVHNSTYRRY